MGEQELQDRLALGFRQLVDLRGEALVDEQRATSAHRMRADHRVRQRRILAPCLFPLGQRFRRVAIALQRKRTGEVVGGGQPFEQGFHRRRQGFIRRDAAGPQGIAAKLRQQLGAEHRAHGRGRQEGHVGVPDRVVAHVGDGGVEDQHLRLFRHVRVDRVNVQVAEIGGESRLLLRRDRLVTEEQHLMLEQRLLDGVALFQVQRLADVDAADLCAEGRA